MLRFRHELTAADRVAIPHLLATTGFFREDEVGVGAELVESRLNQGAASGYEFIVVERAEQLVGYACFGEIPCTLGSYDLYWIAVAPQEQGRGVGRQLLQAVEQAVAARDGRRIYIETSGRAQYLPTQQFYLRCGYELAATLPEFYAPHDPKLVFVRALC